MQQRERDAKAEVSLRCKTSGGVYSPVGPSLPFTPSFSVAPFWPATHVTVAVIPALSENETVPALPHSSGGEPNK